MRLLALVPIFLAIPALVLAFLCIFAGSSKNFMEDYNVFTLNTSRIQPNVVNTTDVTPFDGSNPLTSWLNNVTQGIATEVNGAINNASLSIARQLGLHDFYSVHLMDYCEGFFTPTAVPNDTVSAASIDKNVTSCSNRTAMFTFDPKQALQSTLNDTGSDVTLDQLGWPEDLDKGIKAFKVSTRATFVLYCVAITVIALFLLSSIAGLFSYSRLLVLLNMILAILAFLALGIASAIMTSVGVKGASTINKEGKRIGLSATPGKKLMIITWVATALMIVASLVWCGGCFKGRKGNLKPARVGEKGRGEIDPA